ncbi:MAG TPA: tRNA pseudouridine(55) synthase TruB [Bacteroidales bacterium]
MHDFKKGEVVLINKPLTWTSFDVVNSFRYCIKSKLGFGKLKVGHAGTLDPLATGLLIICTGPFTKKIEEFTEYDKEYTGTFVLGATTASFDMEKPVDQVFPIGHITEELLMAAARQLTGILKQVPPVFSAVKIDGKHAYEYARKEKELLMPPKEVTISEFEITRIALPEVDFRIVCSKGTYIRALARDFGLAANSGAYLSVLCRTRVGPYLLSDSWEMNAFKEFLLAEKLLAVTAESTQQN